MTDKEIIKALPQIKYGGCKGCTYGIFSGDDRCGMKGCKIARDALDLIRRQQTEINHFVEVNKTVAETDKTEDEVLKKLLTQRVEFIPNNYDIKVIQRHAVREFADRLKRMMFITDYDIDNLVIEMFGNPE